MQFYLGKVGVGTSTATWGGPGLPPLQILMGWGTSPAKCGELPFSEMGNPLSQLLGVTKGWDQQRTE